MSEQRPPDEREATHDPRAFPPAPEADPGPLPVAPPSRPAEGVQSDGWPSTPGELPPLVPDDGAWRSEPLRPPAPAGGLESEPGPRAPEPRRHHSRNPVDRLTRGLPDPIRIVVDWVVTIVGAVAIVLLVKAYVINPYRIPSSSMEPTLHCAQPASGCEARFSDRVLANRFLYHLRDPRRGEIVVFETPPAAQAKCGAGGTFVKRLIGLPGETVEVRLENGDGYVYINGRRLPESYLGADRRAALEGYGPKKIPKGAYFMMGDNRAQSCDSRVWGTVPRENLIGKVFATYWPPNRISLH